MKEIGSPSEHMAGGRQACVSLSTRTPFVIFSDFSLNIYHLTYTLVTLAHGWWETGLRLLVNKNSFRHLLRLLSQHISSYIYPGDVGVCLLSVIFLHTISISRFFLFACLKGLFQEAKYKDGSYGSAAVIV